MTLWNAIYFWTYIVGKYLKYCFYRLTGRTISQKLTWIDTAWNKLTGILSRPVKNHDMPVVIVCHGLASSKDEIPYKVLEPDLIQNGIAMFRYDFFWHGESEGDFADITLSKAVESIISAHDLLIWKGFSKIALLGQSFGGCAAFNAAAFLNEGLCCLIGKCPVSDYAKQREERLWVAWMKAYKENGYYRHHTPRWEKKKLHYSFYEDMRNNNVHDKAHLVTIPTLIVHGDQDLTVKIEQSVKTASLTPNCRLEIIEWAWHQFDTPPDARKRMHILFIDFLRRHCK